MKKLLIICLTLFLFSASTLYGQAVRERIFKPFRVGFGVLYETPTAENAGSGYGFYIEPRYATTDNIIMGLHLEGVYLGESSITVDYTAVELESTVMYPILIISEYAFGYDNVRPFVGLGAGIYQKKKSAISTSLVNGVYIGNQSKTNFGIAPRIGINAHHFRLAAIFNFTGKDISNFFGIQLGLELGGGRY